MLALYDLFPEKRHRFPAYAHLDRMFEYGEMFKLCRQALSEAGKPLTTREIALAIIRTKGWNEDDRQLREAVAYRIIPSLTKAAQHGRIGDAGRQSNVRVWGLIDP